MLGTRLLRTAKGGGSFTPPAYVEGAHAILAQADGGVVGITKVSPAAVVDGNTLIVGFVSNGGAVKVCSYDLLTETTTTAVTLDTGAESHAAPSVWVRPSDGRILVYWALHDAATPYVAVSTNPGDATAFGSKTALHSQLGGSTDYTYMSTVWLEDEAKLYLFWRDYTGSTGRLAYSTSSDGTTWASRTLLVTADAGSGNVVYWRVRGNGSDRIDIITTNSDRSDSRPTSLYHLYHAGGGTAWYKSDGTEIAASRPFVASEATLVKSNGDGNLDPGDVYFDGTNPSCVMTAYQSTPSNEVYAGRWDGDSWEVELVADTGGIISGNRFVGGSTLTDADTVWFPKKVGSDFELHRYTKSGTWSGEQLTSGSGLDTMLVQRVDVPHDRIDVISSKGDWTNDSSFSLGVQGWG